MEEKVGNGTSGEPLVDFTGDEHMASAQTEEFEGLNTADQSPKKPCCSAKQLRIWAAVFGSMAALFLVADILTIISGCGRGLLPSNMDFIGKALGCPEHQTGNSTTPTPTFSGLADETPKVKADDLLTALTAGMTIFTAAAIATGFKAASIERKDNSTAATSRP
jgi:hypothetical protein